MIIWKGISIGMLALIFIVSVAVAEKNESVMDLAEITFLLFLIIPMLYIIFN